jgi:hypothetical protein
LKRILILSAVLIALGACATASPEPPTNAEMAANADLSAFWGCGIGFAASNQEQTVALFVYSNHEGPTPPISFPDPTWDARLVVGKDLLSNHCDDVFEPGEPEPLIEEEWQITDGTLEFEVPDGGQCAAAGPVTGTFTGLSATNSNSTVDLGNLTVVNGAYGCFAG